MSLQKTFAFLILVGSVPIVAGPARAQIYGKAVSPPPNHWMQFGSAIDANDNTLIVGAPDSVRNNDTSNCSVAYPGFGSVGVFKKSGGVWSLSQSFWHDPYAATDTADWEPRFGSSVSLRGNTMVVGAERLNWNSVAGAGAFYLFQRTSSTASFTRSGPFFSPTPTESGRIGETGGVATNGRFVAVANQYHSILVYQIVGATATFVTAIPLPVAAPPEKLFITDNDILVGLISGYTRLLAFKLSSTSFTDVDTSALADGSTYSRPAAGDRNSFTSGLNGSSTQFRVVSFGSNAVASIKDLTVPIPADLPNPPTATSPSATGIAIKEGTGIYVSFTGSTVKDAYLAGFLSSAYLPVSITRPTQMTNVTAGPSWGRPITFNGEDLFLSDYQHGSSGGCVSNYPSTGITDGFLAGGLGVAAELAPLAVLQ